MFMDLSNPLFLESVKLLRKNPSMDNTRVTKGEEEERKRRKKKDRHGGKDWERGGKESGKEPVWKGSYCTEGRAWKWNGRKVTTKD